MREGTSQGGHDRFGWLETFALLSLVGDRYGAAVRHSRRYWRGPHFDATDHRDQNLPGGVLSPQIRKFIAPEYQHGQGRAVGPSFYQRELGDDPRAQYGLAFPRTFDAATELFNRDSGDVVGEMVDDPFRQWSIAVAGGRGPAFIGEREPTRGVPFMRVGGNEKSFANAPRHGIVGREHVLGASDRTPARRHRKIAIHADEQPVEATKKASLLMESFPHPFDRDGQTVRIDRHGLSRGVAEPLRFVGQRLARVGRRRVENANGAVLAINRLAERSRNIGFSNLHPRLTQQTLCRERHISPQPAPAYGRPLAYSANPGR